MRQNHHIALSLAIGIFLAPALVSAQQRGGVAPVPMAAPARPMSAASAPGIAHAPMHAVAPTVPLHAGGPALVVGTHPAMPKASGHSVTLKAPLHNHPAQSNPVYFRGPAAEDDNGVPGLGFDYPHYAATHPNAGRSHFHGAGIFPFVGGGIYIPSFGYVDTGVPTETTAEGQQAEGQDATAAVSEPAPAEQTPVAAQVRPRSNPAPLPPSSEYIFVRRDGTVFFAVAYSWVNGNLQYVTRDGFRKLAPTGTLDLDATTQFNEQRGVAFHSPA